MQPLKIHGFIGTEPGYFSLSHLDSYLAALPKDQKELEYEINSGGGSVTEGWAIHDRLKDSGLELKCNIIGKCSSIATIISMAAKPENRSISSNAEYGIHFPYLELESNEAFQAQQLLDIGTDLMQSQKKILDLYVAETGQPKELIETMMAHSRSLSAAEAQRFKFVTNITAPIENAVKYRTLAFIDHTKNTTDMPFSDSQKSLLSKMFTDFSNKIESFFKVPFKNMLIVLESGGQIWVDSETEDWTGKSVFNVDEAGNKTNDPAPDGDYTTKDGKVIMVKDGKVTEVKEKAAQADETAALKAEIETLKTQLETANTAKAQVETTVAEQQKNFVALKKELGELQKVALGTDIPGTDQTFKGDPLKKTQEQEWLAANKKNQELKAKN